MRSVYPNWILPGFNARHDRARKWVYESFLPDVIIMVKTLTNNSPEADDLASDAFVILIQYPSPFSSMWKLRSFLHNTARNMSIDYLRNQQMIGEKSDEVKDYYLSLEQSDLEEADLRAFYNHLIQRAREILPHQCKEIFFLCYHEQLKNAEIAERLGISEKTVANQKLYAYKKLKMEIDPAHGSPEWSFLRTLLL